MGVKERRKRHREGLRQEILDAARELFVTEGYAQTSMRRIAERIEYSPTTIYLYFKDKAELLDQLCEETFAELNKRLEAIERDEPDEIENLRKGLRAYVDFGLENPSHYRVTFMMEHEHTKEDFDDSDTGMIAFAHLRSCVERAMATGRLRSCDVEMTSQALWAGSHGITSLLISVPMFPWTDKSKLVDHLIEMMIRGLQKGAAV